MLADLVNGLGAYIHEVFVLKLDIWMMLGWTAQLLFTARFLTQWIASERAGRSVVPVAFWLFSLAGGLLLLAYALARKDPVFIVGQAAGLFIYARNLHLIFRERRRQSEAASRSSASPVTR